MGFFKRKDSGKVPKEIEKIFNQVYEAQKPSQLLDKAVSHRNLKQFDKAFEILTQVIKKYPDYPPAWTMVGTTFMVKGEIDAAEKHFLMVIDRHRSNPRFSLCEIYANLGLLRWKHRNDPTGALKYYDLALKSPRPDNKEGYVITEEDYEYVKSNVYRDLCVLYFDSGNTNLARQYAIKRLNIVEDCYNASRTLGACILQEDIASDSMPDILIRDGEPETLTLAIRCFRTCLKEKQDDPMSLFGIGLAITFFQLWAGLHERTLNDSLLEEGKTYTQNLFDLAKRSEMAKQLMSNFEQIVARTSKAVILKSAAR